MIAGQEPSFGSTHSWRLYSDASLEDQTVSTMTRYSSQSYYADTELASLCPILVMPSVKLDSDKYQVCTSLN